MTLPSMRDLRRHIVATVVGVVFSFVMLGCKKDDAAPQPGAAAATSPAPAVRLGYFANFTHAQALLGVASGDFEKAVAPSKFSTKVFAAGPSLIEALFAGDIDIGYIGPGPALNGFARSGGANVRVISGSAANGVLIVARKDAGIKTLADLTGKRLATPQYGNTQDIAAKAYVRQVLDRPNVDDVKPVPNAEQAGQMVAGQIDAAWAPEPWGTYLIKQTGATLVAKEESLWPQGNFATTVVITTPAFLAKHPETVKAFLAAHVAWTDRLSADPQPYLTDLKAALFNLTNKNLPPGVLEASVENTLFTTDPLPHTFTRFAGWAYDLDFSKERTDTSALIDVTFLQSVRQQSPAATQPKRRLDE